MSMEDVLLDKIKNDADFIQKRADKMRKLATDIESGKTTPCDGAQLAYDVLWELWHEFGSQVP